MRLFRPGFLIRKLFPDAIFRLSTSEKLLCLTFDDGPDRDSAPSLLGILRKHGIKAVFFCEGREAELNPDLIKQIADEGHLIGNHGYNHLDGWRTSSKNYIEDISKAIPFTSSAIFRPPYGRLRFRQYYALKELYRIIFWDLMPYDFDLRYGSEKSLKLLKKKARPGSIIVLHYNSRSSCPDFIEDFILFAKEKGFRFVNSLI